MAVAFILFFGGNAPTPIERRLDAVRLAIAVRLLQAASKAQFDPIVVVSPDPAVHAGLRRYAEVVAPASTPFHLGRELHGVARGRRLDRLCVTGGGYGALVTTSDLRTLRERIEAADQILVSNNYYSGDLVAFAPAKALDAIDLPTTDNPLPRLLHQPAGCGCCRRSVACRRPDAMPTAVRGRLSVSCTRSSARNGSSHGWPSSARA